MITDLKRCAAALVIVSAAIVASVASSPTDVELDKEDNILVVRVTEDRQRERQERRLDSVASPENSPATIEIFEEKETKNGGEIVEEIEIQGRGSGGQTFRLHLCRPKL